MSNYLIILLAVLIISPILLSLAAKQDQKTKSRLNTVFLVILLAQLVLGFFNWESFEKSGRSGIVLAFEYPESWLPVYFIFLCLQIIFLILSRFSILNRILPVLSVVLNFLNSILVFVGLIRISNILGVQIFSAANVLTVFAALTNNVVGLIWVNKDRDLLKKYFY